MYYLIYYTCKECNKKFCFLEGETIKQDFNPVCSCGSKRLVESGQEEYKTHEEAVKSKSDFDKKTSEKEEGFTEKVESAKSRQKELYFEVRFCGPCGIYYVVTNSDTACGGKIKHNIDRTSGVIPKQYPIEARRAFEEAQKECNKKNMGLPPPEPQECPVRELTYNGRPYALKEIKELHDAVYKDWGIARLFVDEQGIWKYNDDYASFLDEYYYETESNKVNLATGLREKKEEYFNQSKRKRADLLNLINRETNDSNARFFLYIMECGFLQDNRLFWKTANKVVSFDSAESFVREYAGITNICRLPDTEKRGLVNKYTLKYFFFKEEKEIFDYGTFDEEIRLLYLLVRYSGKIPGFGPVDDFRNGLSVYDDKVEKREAFLKQLNPGADWAIAEELKKSIYGEAYTESQPFQSVPDGLLVEDVYYLPQIKNDNFENYLELCRKASDISAHKKFNILGLELPLDTGGAEKAIKSIVRDAYFFQSHASGEIAENAFKKFALLRLIFMMDIGCISDALSSAVNNGNSFFGKVKKSICSNTTYGEIVRKTYFDCCGDIRKKDIKIVEVDKNPRTLLELLKTAKEKSDYYSIAIYENEAVQDLLGQILGSGDGAGFDGYNSVIKKAAEVSHNTKQAIKALEDVINQERAKFIPESKKIPNQNTAVSEVRKITAINPNKNSTDIKGKDKRFTRPV